MLLADLLDQPSLVIAIEDGYVRATEHPTLPLTIFNYAEKAAYEKAWNPITLTCRGLIVDHDGVVRARPWGKFFNFGEHPPGSLDQDAPVEVTDKQDGSLGILYPTGDTDGWAVATRGSFASDQAKHATALYRERYRDRWKPPSWATVLVEIIYPDNRIVLDYQGFDDLVLLGAVDILSGQTYGPNDTWLRDWPGPRTTVFDAPNLQAALEMEPRANAEGVVVRYPDRDLLVKIKQEDYTRIHAIVTNSSTTTVWEYLRDGRSLDVMFDVVPDEFIDWVKGVARDLTDRGERMLAEARADHARVLAALPPNHSRKDYALAAKESPYRALLFGMLDGKDPWPTIWRAIKPEYRRALMAQREAV